jgi:outer membrane immunogenic protein
LVRFWFIVDATRGLLLGGVGVMKRLPVVIAVLASLSGAAFAADLPAPTAVPAYKAPAVVAPAYSWTGFYLSAGGGYGMWNADSQVFLPGGGCVTCQTQNPGGRGYFGKAGGGFDYQFGLNFGKWNPQFVAGVFGDYSFEDIKGTLSDPFVGSAGTLEENSAWAAGVRFGAVIAPGVMTYSNVGVTGTHFDGVNFASQATGLGNGQFSPGFSRTTWFTGGGFESSLDFILPPGFFLRTEYRYAYFDSSNIATAGTVANVISFKPTVQTLSTELMYRFNWH